MKRNRKRNTNGQNISKNIFNPYRVVVFVVVVLVLLNRLQLRTLSRNLRKMKIMINSTISHLLERFTVLRDEDDEVVDEIIVSISNENVIVETRA